MLSALATWQLSREPVHYGRITFLLALAIGIGWFATSFRATVTNSHEDQARYSVGTDARLIERDTRLNVNRARPLEVYESHPAVEAASAAFRVINANLLTGLTGELRGNILAIDPDTFADTIYWREDLGDIETPHPAGEPLDLPEVGEPLPFVPERSGMDLLREERLQLHADFSVLSGCRTSDAAHRSGVFACGMAGAWVVAPLERARSNWCAPARTGSRRARLHHQRMGAVTSGPRSA